MNQNELLALRLTPEQFMAAAFILSREVNGQSYTRTLDLAVILQCSPATARRIVASLVDMGVLLRIIRGTYAIQNPNRVSEQRAPVSEQRAPVSEKFTVSTSSTSKTYLALVSPNGLPKGAPPLFKGIQIIKKEHPLAGWIDDDADLHISGGWDAPKAKPTKRSRSVPVAHRLIPRELWDMAFVAKEFRLRISQAVSARDLALLGSDGNKLLMTLKVWEVDYNLTPREAATLCDQFFDSKPFLSNKVAPFRMYLEFMKRNIDQIRGKVLSEDFKTKVAEQVLPWE